MGLLAVRESIAAAVAAGCLALAGPLPAQYPDPADSAVAIPMRDGVVLAATLLRPPGPGPFPVLVYRTPYDRQEAIGSSGVPASARSRGYAVLLQDVRGRYASAGAFEAYRHEGADGYDTIEWAAAQPWSNGLVGSFGLSYPGAVQWLAAVERPPHLGAMVPAMTYATPETFWYSGGVWDGSWLDWVWFNIAPDLRRRLALPGPATDSAAAAEWEREKDRVRRHLPLATLADFQGVAPWYYEWMRHPPGDPWWQWATLTGKYDQVDAAVLNLSGWFDEPYGPYGAVTSYTSLIAAGQRGRARLVLGPWTHGVGAVGRNRAGEREFGPGAGIAYDSLVLDWMDRHLRGDETLHDTIPPVQVFVMGSNRWRGFPGWPPPGQHPDTFYLQSSARGGEIVRAVPGDRSSPASFRSDPAHPLEDPFGGATGAHDYRALTAAANLLVYETAPFDTPYQIIGAVVAEVTVSATVPDFDLWLQLYDVAPDGTAWNLSGPGTALQRASYRHGGPARQLVPTGQPVCLRLDHLITANTFLPGHRLRVVLSGAFAPYFSRNLQTGALEFSSARSRAGVITIHHAADLASRLILPTLPLKATP